MNVVKIIMIQKKTWDVIRSILPPNKKSSQNTNQMVNLNPNLIKKLSDFFCSI